MCGTTDDLCKIRTGKARKGGPGVKTSRQRGFRPWIRVQKQPQVRNLCVKILYGRSCSSGRLIAASTVWAGRRSAGAWGHRRCREVSSVRTARARPHPSPVSTTPVTPSPKGKALATVCSAVGAPAPQFFNLYCKYSVNRLQLYQIYGIIIGSIFAAYRHTKIQPQSHTSGEVGNSRPRARLPNNRRDGGKN